MDAQAVGAVRPLSYPQRLGGATLGTEEKNESLPKTKE